MPCEDDVFITVASICVNNYMSYASNNYKLLLNDQNECGVLDMIE